MFSYLMAAFWIGLGFIFLWRETFLLKRIRKRGKKLILRYMIALCTFASISILSLAWDFSGALSKIIGLILTVSIWIVAYRQNLKIKEHFAAFCEQKLNGALLKRIALIHILIGVGIIITTTVSNRTEKNTNESQAIEEKA